MLQLLAFQAYNWGYAPFMHPLPIGLLNLCYGDNGSGKTTYLTGISLLLGVSRLPKGKKADHYIREGENWAFLKAVANNSPGGDGKRPFDRLLPNIQQHDTCTLACLFVYKHSEWKRTYYIVPGETFEPKPEGRFDSSCTFSSEKYREALEQIGVRSATMRLLELGVTGMHDLYESRRLFTFFVELIGSETIRANYTQARREWQNAEKLLETTQARFSQQEDEIEHIGKAIEAQRKRRELEQAQISYQYFVDYARLRSLKISYEEKKNRHNFLTQQKLQTGQVLRALEMRLTGLQAENDEFVRHQQQWRHQRNQAELVWNQQSTKRARTADHAQRSADAIADLSRPPIYNAEVVALSLQQQEDREASQRQLILALEKQQNMLIQEEGELKQGQSSFPTDVKIFLQTLREHDIPFHIVADAVNIDIGHKMWLKAVEGILGAERFTIIVHDSQLRLHAKQLAERSQYRYWISPPKGTRARSIPPDSLLRAVQIINEHAAGWIEDHLFSIHCVDTVEQGDRLSEREGWITITPEAYRQEPRGGRSVYPYQMVCGQAARQERLREIIEEFAQLKTPLREAYLHLNHIQQNTAALREQLQRAREQQQILVKEQEYTHIFSLVKQEQEEEIRLRTVYEHLKNQELEWEDRKTRLALQEQEVTLDKMNQSSLLENTNKELSVLLLGELHREIERLEVTLSPLTPVLQAVFDEERLSEGEYRKRLQEIEQKLDQLPRGEDFYDEAAYEQQRADVRSLGIELEQTRHRVKEHRDLFEKALQDYSDHLDDLFGQRMAREFRKLCPLANAQGNLLVQKSDDVNDWSLDVRIGFDGKNRMSLLEAPLSRGQEVLTSLYLVLAALRAVHATPILLLDELVALLDESNAPKVLAGLRETGVQAFVATPQNRLGANEEADVLWGFSRKGTNQVEAPAIAVLVRRPTESQKER